MTLAEKHAELAWKWTLRTAGLGAFFYILITKNGDAPAGVFVIIGGLIGLPNIIQWQKQLNEGEE